MGKRDLDEKPTSSFAKKVKGTNFYRDATKAKRVKLLRGGKDKRDRTGNIVPGS